MAVYDITTQTIDVDSLEPGDILNCPYTGSEQSIELPTGKYILEVWGGSSSDGYTFINAGYATGELNLNDSTELYLYVGSSIDANVQSLVSDYWAGGWNGGGTRIKGSRWNDSGSGGGATDICLVSSNMNIDSYGRYIRSRESYLSRLIVAGGSGGVRDENSPYAKGGYCPSRGLYSEYSAGGMTSPGSVTDFCITGDFGYGATSNQTYDDYSAGGGGWYGGGIYSETLGGGGSSFAWCEDLAEFVPDDWNLSNSYYLSNVDFKFGEDSLTEPDGNINIGHFGDGYARITIIDIVAGNNEITYVSEYSEQPMKKCNNTLKSSHLPIQSDVIGHKFEAWYYESTFETKANIGDTVTGNLTLYAKWNDCITHTITNNLKGIWCDNEAIEINEGDDYVAYYDSLDGFDMYTPEVKILYGNDNISNIFDYNEHLVIIENVNKDIEINIAGAIDLSLPSIELFDPDVTYKLTIKEPNAGYNTETYTGRYIEIILDQLFMQDEENEFIDDFILVFKGEGE